MKIAVEWGAKVGFKEPYFGSNSAGVRLEVEIAAGSDEVVQAQTRRLFVLAKAAVAEELKQAAAVQPPGNGNQRRETHADSF